MEVRLFRCWRNLEHLPCKRQITLTQHSYLPRATFVTYLWCSKAALTAIGKTYWSTSLCMLPIFLSWSLQNISKNPLNDFVCPQSDISVQHESTRQQIYSVLYRWHRNIVSLLIKDEFFWHHYWYANSNTSRIDYYEPK